MDDEPGATTTSGWRLIDRLRFALIVGLSAALIVAELQDAGGPGFKALACFILAILSLSGLIWPIRVHGREKVIRRVLFAILGIGFAILASRFFGRALAH